MSRNVHSPRADSAGNEHGDHQRLRALNDVLQVAFRNASLLEGPALQQLGAALARHVPLERLLIVVVEQGAQLVYAASANGTGDSGLLSIVPEGSQPFRWPDEPQVRDAQRQRDMIEKIPGAERVAAYITVPIRRPDGSPRAHLLLLFREANLADQAPMQLLSDVADVVGAKLEQASQVERERCRAKIVESCRDAVVAWDFSGRIIEANDAALALTGMSRAELVGESSIDDILSPLQRLEAQDSGPIRMEVVAKGGRVAERRVPVSATVTPVQADPVVAGHAVLRDDSRALAAEREAASHLARIRVLENELRTLLDNAPLIIFRLDPDTGQLLYLNQQAERLLGAPTDEALRTPGFLRELHADPQAVQLFDNAFRRARQGMRSPSYEASLRWGSGAEVVVRGTIYPLLADNGDVVAVEGILADVSVEHAARTRLVKADRLSTLGTLAASVAHEINNPAGFITLGLARLQTLLSTVADSATRTEVGTLVSDLREAIDRIAGITHDLRLFAGLGRTPRSRPTFINVGDAVRGALTLARAQIMARADVELDLQPVPNVLMEEGRLNQVLVNIMVNAAHAIERQPGEGHRVTVSTRCDGDTVEITVSDTGSGIPADSLDRIWVPFFTTKSADVGTGLGLPISKEIIERAGGTIHATSPILETEGRAHGSSFVIRLPVANGDETLASNGASDAAKPRSRKRVLLIDDERPLLNAMASELDSVHDVTVAADGGHALELMRERRFDAILCDLRMPGMSGEDLYQRAAASHPDNAGVFIFMTGVGPGPDVERFLSASDRPCLQKPFSIEQALEAIEAVAVGSG